MPPRLLLPLLATLVLDTVGCASRYEVPAGPPTYAAVAKIRVKVNPTDNREVHIDVQHLAPPARIDPSYRAYAVWISVPGHGITKAGLLDYDENRRRGKIVATTPHPKFEVLISLERESTTSNPSQQIVLRKLVTHG